MSRLLPPSDPPVPMWRLAPPASLLAHQTLLRGSRFLAAGLSGPSVVPRPILGPCRPRVIGNGLREMDRFLHNLLVELNLVADFTRHTGRRNTASRLDRFRESLGTGNPDCSRIRALERSQACLFFCGGEVRRGDARDGAMMTIGWHEGASGKSPLRKVAVGSRLAVSTGDVIEVCDFFAELGTQLMTEVFGRRQGAWVARDAMGEQSLRLKG
jgi:hypothetical protein